MLRNIVFTASALAALVAADTVYMNSVTDFCLWAPPPGSNVDIGNAEAYVVSYCTQSGKGSNTMPAGTITSAHWVETPDYIQITGKLDGTKINIIAGDAGGELDPHGATNEGNPVGGRLVTAKWGDVAEWNVFISADEYCIKGCRNASDGWLRCQHIYDTEGCYWNMPGNYGDGFDMCLGDSDGYPGIVGSSTFHHGDATTPAARAAGATSSCQAVATVGNGIAAPSLAGAAAATSTATTSSAANSTSSSTSLPVISTSTALNSTSSVSSSSTTVTVTPSPTTPAAARATTLTSGTSTLTRVPATATATGAAVVQSGSAFAVLGAAFAALLAF